MIDIKLPELNTKLKYDVPITQKDLAIAVTGQIIDLKKSFGKKLKVWKKLSNSKVLCKVVGKGDKSQYVLELENLKGTNTIQSALNKWKVGRFSLKDKKFKGKELNFTEKVYLSHPRMYEIRFNKELFHLDVRIPHLKELGRDLLQRKRRIIKRNGKIRTTLIELGFLTQLEKYDFEKTLETNREVAEKLLDNIVELAVETEIKPPAPIIPPFYFRKAEIKAIGEHLIKLCGKDAKSNDEDLINLDSVMSFLEDDFDEVVTKKEVVKIEAKMKRKTRKIARKYHKEHLATPELDEAEMREWNENMF